MEILFWLQPIFSTFCVLGVIISFISFCAFCLMLAYNKTEDRNDNLGFGKLSKKMLVTCICIGLLAIFSAPISEVKDIYKNILIYRGINSALADKAANTADKMFDVLNKKLDEEMKK